MHIVLVSFRKISAYLSDTLKILASFFLLFHFLTHKKNSILFSMKKKTANPSIHRFSHRLNNNAIKFEFHSNSFFHFFRLVSGLFQNIFKQKK